MCTSKSFTGANASGKTTGSSHTGQHTYDHVHRSNSICTWLEDDHLDRARSKRIEYYHRLRGCGARENTEPEFEDAVDAAIYAVRMPLGVRGSLPYIIFESLLLLVRVRRPTVCGLEVWVTSK